MGAQKYQVIFPAQCECGHLYLERYQFSELTPRGDIGFVWCGFCRTKRMVRPYIVEETVTSHNTGSTQAGVPANAHA